MGKIEKTFYWLCFFLAVYITIGFKLIPYVLKDQLVKNLDDNLTLKTTIEKVEFNPFTLEAKIHNLALNNKDSEKVISFSQFKLNIALLRSILEAHVSLDNVLLQNTVVNVEEDINGIINLTKIVKEKETEKKEEIKDESSSDIKFLISKIKLENLNVNYKKITKDKPYELTIKNANYTLYDVGTYKNSLASNDLELNINEHTKLSLKGAFNVSPFKMYGKAKISDLRLKEILYQQKEILNFDINEEARFDLALDYNIDAKDDFDLKVNTTKLELSDIKLKQNKNDIIKLNKLKIGNLNLDLLKQDLKLNNIEINTLYTNLIMDKNGINLASLVKASKETKKEAPISDEKTISKPWKVLLSNLKQTNSDFIFKDKVQNMSVETKKFNTNVSSVNIDGSNIYLNSFKISNPNIDYKDNKNSMFINTNNSDISFDKLSILDNNIDISNVNLSKSNLSFKDNKASLNININKPKLNINSLKIKGADVYIKQTKLDTPKISFKDLKNKLSIQTSNTALNVNDLNIIKSIVSINRIKLNTPSLKLNDAKAKLDISTNNTSLTANKLNINGSKISLASASLVNPKLNINDKANNLKLDINKINANINSFLLNNNNISIKTAKIKKGKLTLNDNKNSMNIYSSNAEVNINRLKQNNNTLSLSSIRVYDPSVTIENKKDKTNIIAKNIDISVSGITNSKNGLKVLKTDISKPNISVILEKNNAKAAVAKKTENKSSKESSAKLNIGPINIKNATLSFEDKNLPLPFKTTVSALNGKVSRLNTTVASTSKLKVDGIVDKYGTTQITGLVDPNNIKILTDINMIFKNISMQNFTPYTGKFIGKELKSGKLDLDLKYNIEKSNLDAKNNIVITKLELGKKVVSKDAVSLPLDLAITLLEDRNGVIDLSIPVSGNMDDPQFSIGPIVWKAFVNLITKAITAPFSLLGSIFGFEADEINSVNFNYAQDEITPIQKETLDKVSVILLKRPNLVLEFDPSYEKEKDLYALKTNKLNKFISNELPNKQAKDYQEDYLELLEELYEDYDQELETLKNKFPNDLKAYTNALESFVTSKQEVKKAELSKIALNRVNNIKKYLLEKKKIPAKQIKISKKIKIKTTTEKTSNIDLKISK